ncbi:TPA: hypothetical protein ACKP3B_004752, partial [Serratia marcescens]
SKNLLFKAGFFSSAVYEDEHLRRRFEPREARRRQARAAMRGLFAYLRMGTLSLSASVLVFSDSATQRCRQVETNN